MHSALKDIHPSSLCISPLTSIVMDLKGVQNDIHLCDGYCHDSFNTSADLPQGLWQQFEVKIDKNEETYKDEDIYEDNYDDEDEENDKDSDLVTFLKNSWAEAAL